MAEEKPEAMSLNNSAMFKLSTRLAQAEALLHKIELASRCPICQNANNAAPVIHSQGCELAAFLRVGGGG